MIKISLAAARKNANLTQKQVADSLNVAVSTVQNWELGKTYPKLPQVEQLCDLYKMPFDHINFVE